MAGDRGSIPGRETKIPHAMLHSQKINSKQKKVNMDRFQTQKNVELKNVTKYTYSIISISTELKIEKLENMLFRDISKYNKTIKESKGIKNGKQEWALKLSDKYIDIRFTIV